MQIGFEPETPDDYELLYGVQQALKHATRKDLRNMLQGYLTGHLLEALEALKETEHAPRSDAQRKG